MFILNIMCLLQEFPDVLECTVSHAVEKINPDEREEMKVSGKIQSFQFILLHSGIRHWNKPFFAQTLNVGKTKILFKHNFT